MKDRTIPIDQTEPKPASRRLPREEDFRSLVLKFNRESRRNWRLESYVSEFFLEFGDIDKEEMTHGDLQGIAQAMAIQVIDFAKTALVLEGWTPSAEKTKK